MASFPPLKAHIVSKLDELVCRYELMPPFLDLGCGIGDVSVHLARRGWSGVALDPSPDAVIRARAALASHPDVGVALGTIENLSERFPTILALDVLEHVRDDEALLHQASRLQFPSDMIVLVVPTHPGREWRWDDGYYGHFRRYSLGGLSALLERTGYMSVEMIELTFPVFWLMRRIYTALLRPPRIEGTPEERSLRAADARAWQVGLGAISRGRPLRRANSDGPGASPREHVLSGAVALPASCSRRLRRSTLVRRLILSGFVSRVFPWRTLLASQRAFEGRPELGHEVMVLAKRASAR